MNTLSPYTPTMAIPTGIEQLVMNVLSNDWLGGSRLRSMRPKIRTHNTNEALIVDFELPGLHPDNITVSCIKNKLCIAAHNEVVEKEGDGAEKTSEATSYRYYQEFYLNEEINTDSITANYNAGILTLTIPNPPEPEPTNIKVTTNTP